MSWPSSKLEEDVTSGWGSTHQVQVHHRDTLKRNWSQSTETQDALNTSLTLDVPNTLYTLDVTNTLYTLNVGTKYTM